jgi:hypothetical protein
MLPNRSAHTAWQDRIRDKSGDSDLMRTLQAERAERRLVEAGLQDQIRNTEAARETRLLFVPSADMMQAVRASLQEQLRSLREEGAAAQRAREDATASAERAQQLLFEV